MSGKSYTISAIQQIINAGGTIVKEYIICDLLTDSRRITKPAESLFFALSGRRDGHGFIAEAYSAGVRNFVVKQGFELKLSEVNFLNVPDVLTALQKLVAEHRSRFNLEVIGITGSNGKTIVKEWLYQLMSADKNIIRNTKSYNSQIGVPLSVWKINDRNDLGIFEAGISTINEMNRLEAVIQPTVGILTHIGTAHDEGFRDRQEKVMEKLGLFKNCKLLICNYEELIDYRSNVSAKKLFSWSFKSQEADLYIVNRTITANNAYFRAKFKDQEIECLVPFIDDASVENAALCWATLLAFGYSPAESAKRIEHLSAVSMRLELKSAINDCSVIDDSYNSDIQSLEIALNFLDQQNQHPKKTLILSDIFQSGLQPEVLYRQVADIISTKKVDKFIGVGEGLSTFKHYFNTNEKYFYADTAALSLQLRSLNFKDETILIKGSRSFEFERISRALVQKAHETVMEINLNALIGNLNFYRSKLKPGVKVMAMVKAFSYGSGTFEVANILQYNKADYLAVAYIDEGVALRKAGITLPLMVLNPEGSAFDKLTEFTLEPVLYSFTLFDNFIKYALENNITSYPVHLKIDTGMHRLGFEDFEVETLCNILNNNKHVNVRSVFSHLVAGDAQQHDDFTLKQIDIFVIAYKKIEDVLQYRVIKHLLNTSGVTRWPAAQFDMVRIGLGLYGIDTAIEDGSGLQPVATLKTSVAQVKKVKEGETVSYNRSGSLLKDGSIATVRIGYADGYLRAFGKGVGKMLVKGQLLPTVGNITMDMCMLDSTGVDIKEGDEVIVFDGERKIEELAAEIGTIPYEILTNVSQRVKRVYFYE